MPQCPLCLAVVKHFYGHTCPSERTASAPSDATACSAEPVAIIRRKGYPQNYVGHNEHGPMWSSSVASAKRVPVGDVQAIINAMAANGTHAWGEIHPQNA
jgi:hypothetical protein